MADVPVLEAAPKKADKAKDAAAPAAKAPGVSFFAGKKKLVFIAIGVLVLGLGAGGWFMFAGKAEHPAAAAKGKEKGKANAAQATEKEDEDEHPVDPKAPPIFFALDPPFVVNFEAETLVRFLQVTAQIMSRDLETVELIKANDPIIRNDLLLLLGNQKYQTIATREGKEALRAQALDTVRNVVKSAGGKPSRVEAVYFTSFVMQ